MAEQTTSVEPPTSDAGAPEYGASYFLNYWGGGGPYERNERWLKFFGEVADGIVRDLHPTSVLDAGCAMGFLVEALGKRGVDAWGIDISEYAIAAVDESVAERCCVGSLTEPLPRRYDLITCIEVLEHIPPAEADKAIANLCQATDRLLLSTTPRDYGEPTHLNVQPPEAWSAALAKQGFFRDLERDFSYVSPWATLYARGDESPPETVRRYDRAWWRLRQERAEVRASLLASQERLAELEGARGFEDRSELQSEIDRRDEEILRLRDLLIGKDVELGAARGQLAVLEDNSRRLAGAALRIQSRIPGAMRLGGIALRRLQGRRR
jgi:SAM-dependent methyltransferase